MPKTMMLHLPKVQETLAALHLRVDDRFARSGLSDLVGQVHALSKEVEAQVEVMVRPHVGIRIGVGLIVFAIIAILVVLIGHVRSIGETTLYELIQTLEAGTSEVVFLTAGFVLLLTWETRIKRRRVVQAIRRLRELAHIVDMLQLTKDPDGVAGVSQRVTAHSPRRELDAWELGRYLDYCSELLSLLSKLGYFYVARFDDHEAVGAVNELEDLTNGLSRKIWQKIMIVRATPSAPRPAAAGSAVAPGRPAFMASAGALDSLVDRPSGSP